MIERLVLDTHVLQWYLEGHRKLNKEAKTAIGRPPPVELIVPALCLLEFYSVIDRGKTPITRDQLHNVLRLDERFRVWPMTKYIVEIASTITAVDSIHDRAIVATAIAAGSDGIGDAILLTADRQINASGSVRLLWAGDEKYA
jgi:PIN domain nuclease of toxin-antitoxin system